MLVDVSSLWAAIARVYEGANPFAPAGEVEAGVDGLPGAQPAAKRWEIPGAANGAAPAFQRCTTRRRSVSNCVTASGTPKGKKANDMKGVMAASIERLAEALERGAATPERGGTPTPSPPPMSPDGAAKQLLDELDRYLTDIENLYNQMRVKKAKLPRQTDGADFVTGGDGSAWLASHFHEKDRRDETAMAAIESAVRTHDTSHHCATFDIKRSSMPIH
jgi:hypothetical protein